MKLVIGLAISIIIQFLSIETNAQKIKIDSAKVLSGFIPQEKVLFEDDFSHDKEAGFPSYWKLQLCDVKKYKIAGNITGHTKVTKIDGKYAVLMSEYEDTLLPAGYLGDVIEPIITNNLSDSFTLEYDFKTTSASRPEIFLANREDDKCLGEPIIIYKNERGWNVYYTFLVKNVHPVYVLTNDIPIHFDIDCSKWHHFALSYNKRKLNCYLDNNEILNMQDCKCTPVKFRLSSLIADSVAYTNVRLASGKNNRDESFNRFKNLLTEKKFTTHAINFDVNKSIIKPESIDFINQLAEWLKQNPTVNLEIDGHTDNSGDAAANIKLSQARAEEVKKKLVYFGISSSRLNTKGYGASKPISPNTTDEDKANNRRVEFIKL